QKPRAEFLDRSRKGIRHIRRRATLNEVGPVAAHPLRKGMKRTISIQQRQQSHLLVLRPQLLRHFKRHQPAERTAEQIVWSIRLQRMDLLEVVTSHILNTRQRRSDAVESQRLKRIDRLFRVEMICQRSIDEHVGARRVYTKERRPRTAGANRY